MDNTRIPFKNTVISAAGAPAAGTAGGDPGQPLRDGGLNAVNLWGTGGGLGVPADRAMLALDGVFVQTVTLAANIAENDPIYIDAANALSDTAAGNTLYGYSDDAATAGTRTIGVRISNAIGA